jgi:hypothetical protein
MHPKGTYATSGAFRKALEDRLRNIAGTEQVDLNRLRRQVSFDRLLTRLFRIESAPWALKGGYALELRLKAARATIDIDLALPSNFLASAHQGDANEIVHEMLQEAASVPLGDWFVYGIGSAVKDLEAAPYGGARYPVEARMDARTFARFHLDVGIGETVMRPLETVEGRDWLRFAGIGTSPFRMIPSGQQFAEKLHAYTLPRSTPNSRVKDLIDFVLLIRSGNLEKDRTAKAVGATFEHRKTHPLPSMLVAPPVRRGKQFSALASECNVPDDMQAAFEVVQAFFRLMMANWGR